MKYTPLNKSKSISPKRFQPPVQSARMPPPVIMSALRACRSVMAAPPPSPGLLPQSPAEKAKQKSGRTSYGGGSKGGHIKLGYGFWACVDLKMRVVIYHDFDKGSPMPVGYLGEVLMIWQLEHGYRGRVEQFVKNIGLGTATKREDIAF